MFGDDGDDDACLEAELSELAEGQIGKESDDGLRSIGKDCAIICATHRIHCQ